MKSKDGNSHYLPAANNVSVDGQLPVHRAVCLQPQWRMVEDDLPPNGAIFERPSHDDQPDPTEDINTDGYDLDES